MAQVKYHVQATVEDKSTFPYHTSVTDLWEKKWKKPASMGVYPFVDGKVDDFQQVFDQLIKDSGDDYNVLYDPDRYATPFFPVAESLTAKGKEALDSGDQAAAKDFYLRAAAIYRIARFPINRSPLSQKAWVLGKEAYLAASPYLSPPNEEVLMPFKHALDSAGEKTDAQISGYLRIPTGAAPEQGWPVLLFICGLDAYRTDHTNRTDAHVQHGFAVLSVEIPGTGDCPAAPNDPQSPDRLWSSVLDWVKQYKGKYNLDTAKIVVRGVSTGGYYAMRIAHTHESRLFAAVAQGGGSHYMFDEPWIRAQNHMEYPFALGDALAAKFGYNGDIDKYIADEPRAKFSLLDNGIFDMPCTRLLVINGMEDSIFPIEDSELAARRGRVKDVRFVDGAGHMGNPAGEGIIYDWIDRVMKGQ